GRRLFNIDELDLLPRGDDRLVHGDSVVRSMKEKDHADQKEWKAKEDEGTRHLAGRTRQVSCPSSMDRQRDGQAPQARDGPRELRGGSAASGEGEAREERPAESGGRRGSSTRRAKLHATWRRGPGVAR